MSPPESQTAYLVKLRDRHRVAERTMAFQFEKPEGFTFKAGQSIDVTLLDPPETDGEGNGRAFSIASAPDEGMLLVATRMRDTAFKRVLGAVPIGSRVKIEGPFGNLVLHNDQNRAAVLLAGGIGITPFRSILLRATSEHLPHRLFCFYANRRPEDAPFLQELEALRGQNPSYTFVPTMTDMSRSDSSYRGETGRIDQAMIVKHLKSAASPIYYLAGPPGMVRAMRTVLNSMGVDDDDIRTEEFAGY
ncbi:MAG: FAD-dependent oxidoreductase [Nitrospira sp.]|nr:FAD-dependent oxidoreductase [Nitrospira sp.]